MEKTENLVTISLETYDRLKNIEKNIDCIAFYNGLDHSRLCVSQSPLFKKEREAIAEVIKANMDLESINIELRYKIENMKTKHSGNIKLIKEMSIWKFLKYRKQ